MDVIKDIAAIVGCIISIITLLTICSKNGRAVITFFFKENTKEIRKENEQQTKDIKEIKETLDEVLIKVNAEETVAVQQCRDTIKNIYYKYHATKIIPLYERKTADKTYEIYFNTFHGNSYAALLYNEICKWEIDTLSYDLLEE